MKTFVLLSLLIALPIVLPAQSDNEVNVLSYYAVTNSIDGQLMVETQNVMRFYPIFALRQDIDTVAVTIYYGSKIYTRNALRTRMGSYWQVLLPLFTLGEAIQRIEVEVHLNLARRYASSFNELTQRAEILKGFVSQANQQFQDKLADLAKVMETGRDEVEESRKALEVQRNSIEKIRSSLSTMTSKVDRLAATNPQKYLDTLLNDLRDRRLFLQRWDSVMVGGANAISRKLQQGLGQLASVARVLDELGKQPGRESVMPDSIWNRIEGSSAALGRASEIFKNADSLMAKTSFRFVPSDSSVISHLVPLWEGDLRTVKSLRDTVVDLDSSVNSLSLLIAEDYKLTRTTLAAINSAAGRIKARLQQMDFGSFLVKAYRDTILTVFKEQMEFKSRVLDSLARLLQVSLLDTSFAGPSILKSDIVIVSESEAHILYRNYKRNLRFMPALDPAERLGIFRARYVPFPIVGIQSSPRMNLKRPLSTTSPTVFEIGLAFGNAIVPGDEFVPPEFSWRRLGIAFAITERLFSDSAEVIGLAFTYDFNSYGSIGIGGNFARNEVHGYASLGINKRAFEAVIKGLAALFK